MGPVRLKLFAVLLAIFVSAPAVANTVHPPLSKVSEKELVDYLTGKKIFYRLADGENRFWAILHKGGDLDGAHSGPMLEGAEEEPARTAAKGKWSVSGDTVTIEIGPNKQTWKQVLVSKEMIGVGEIVGGKKKRGFSVFVYRRLTDGDKCYLGPTLPGVKLVPGAKDRRLFEAVKERAERSPLLSMFGKEAKTPRKVSEIWYVAGHAMMADIVAEEFEDLTGPLKRKKWTWGSQSEVILVVGEKKAGAK